MPINLLDLSKKQVLAPFEFHAIAHPATGDAVRRGVAFGVVESVYPRRRVSTVTARLCNQIAEMLEPQRKFHLEKTGRTILVDAKLVLGSRAIPRMSPVGRRSTPG
jgi:hypothetical protein